MSMYSHVHYPFFLSITRHQGHPLVSGQSNKENESKSDSKSASEGNLSEEAQQRLFGGATAHATTFFAAKPEAEPVPEAK